jgi:hypothetical protein
VGPRRVAPRRRSASTGGRPRRPWRRSRRAGWSWPSSAAAT